MPSKNKNNKIQVDIINAAAWRANLELGGNLPPMKKSKSKPKYNEGGFFGQDASNYQEMDALSLVGPGLETASGIVEVASPDKKGTFDLNEGKMATQAGLKMAGQVAPLALNPAVLGATGGLSALAIPIAGATGAIMGKSKADKQQKQLHDIWQENYMVTKEPALDLNYKSGGLLPISVYANGGDMSLMPGIGNPGMGELTELEGPKHEEGGIPIGKNAEVEGGEVKLDDYIFSDTLKIPTTKKTFADMAKTIKKKYEDRPLTDGPSKRSRDAELLKLMKLNEVERIKEEESQAALEMQMGKDMATFGGFIDINDEGILQVDDKINEDFINAAAEVGMTPQKYAVELYKCGGMINKYANGGNLNFSSKGDYHKWLGYVHAKGLAESTSGNQKISIAGKEHRVKHAPGGFLGDPPPVLPIMPIKVSAAEAWMADPKALEYERIKKGRQSIIDNDPRMKVLAEQGVNPFQYTAEEALLMSMEESQNPYANNLNTKLYPEDFKSRQELEDYVAFSGIENLGFDPTDNTIGFGKSSDELLKRTDLTIDGTTAPKGSTIYDDLGEDFLKDQSKKSKISAEEIALAAASMPGLVNLLQSFDPEVTKFDRVNLDTISLENQRKATERDLAKARAIARENTRGSGRSKSEVLANLATANAALTDKEISADLQSYITEETTNTQIKNQEKQINQQTAINEYIANEQNRSKAKDLQALAASDLSTNIQGYIKDKKLTATQEKINKETLSLINSIDPNYKIGKNPETDEFIIKFISSYNEDKTTKNKKE